MCLYHFIALVSLLCYLNFELLCLLFDMNYVCVSHVDFLYYVVETTIVPWLYEVNIFSFVHKVCLICEMYCLPFVLAICCSNLPLYVCTCIPKQIFLMHTSRGSSFSYHYMIVKLPLLQIHMLSSNTKKGEIERTFL